MRNERYNLLKGKRKIIREDHCILMRMEEGENVGHQEEGKLVFMSDCLFLLERTGKKFTVREWIWLQDIHPTPCIVKTSLSGRCSPLRSVI